MIRVERPKSFDGLENNDCGVLALAAALCIPYDAAHVALQAMGRVARRGTNSVRMQHAIQSFGHVCDRQWIKLDGYNAYGRRKRPTAAHVLDHVPARGHFIVGTTHHWFAVVDGVIYDNGALKPRKRLELYIQVIL